MEKKLHHYRNVAKSDHLSFADLEDMKERGHELILTISKSEQFQGDKTVLVAGKKINANIIHFSEKGIKPMVVNMSNGKTISDLTQKANNFDPPSLSRMVEKWVGTTIKLYVDSKVRMKGEIVSGIRVSPNVPKITKPELSMDNPAIQTIADYWNGDKRKSVLSKFEVTPAIAKKLEAMKGEDK